MAPQRTDTQSHPRAVAANREVTLRRSSNRPSPDSALFAEPWQRLADALDDVKARVLELSRAEDRVSPLPRRQQNEPVAESPADPADERLPDGQEWVSHTFGLTYDPLRKLVFRDDHPIRLRPREYELFAYFVLNRRQRLGNDQILEPVWGEEFLGASRVLHTGVWRLRRAIGPGAKRLISVQRELGYFFDP